MQVYCWRTPSEAQLATAGSNLPHADRPLDDIAQGIEDEYRVEMEMDLLRDRWFAEHPGGAFRAYREQTPDDMRPRATTKRARDGETGSKPAKKGGNRLEM